MKIGFSLGRCVRDIAKGIVDIDDVAFIIAATNIDDTDLLKMVILSYSSEEDYLYGLDEDLCQQIALSLWNSNKILQPRKQGIKRHMQPENSVWVDIFPTKPSANSIVQNAWNNYRMLLNMIENIDTEALETFK